mmetsp:Transcript_45976/g.149407  ORF Transcript_45976/g.149407 Transcript_45976/m.149407 type:complete len:518 (-) Transcript_45976:182-1735(-)
MSETASAATAPTPKTPGYCTRSACVMLTSSMLTRSTSGSSRGTPRRIRLGLRQAPIRTCPTSIALMDIFCTSVSTRPTRTSTVSGMRDSFGRRGISVITFCTPSLMKASSQGATSLHLVPSGMPGGASKDSLWKAPPVALSKYLPGYQPRLVPGQIFRQGDRRRLPQGVLRRSSGHAGGHQVQRGGALARGLHQRRRAEGDHRDPAAAEAVSHAADGAGPRRPRRDGGAEYVHQGDRGRAGSDGRLPQAEADPARRASAAARRAPRQHRGRQHDAGAARAVPRRLWRRRRRRRRRLRHARLAQPDDSLWRGLGRLQGDGLLGRLPAGRDAADGAPRRRAQPLRHAAPLPGGQDPLLRPAGAARPRRRRADGRDARGSGGLGARGQGQGVRRAGADAQRLPRQAHAGPRVRGLVLGQEPGRGRPGGGDGGGGVAPRPAPRGVAPRPADRAGPRELAASALAAPARRVVAFPGRRRAVAPASASGGVVPRQAPQGGLELQALLAQYRGGGAVRGGARTG